MKKLTLIFVGLTLVVGCAMTPDEASSEARSNIQYYRTTMQEEQQEAQVVLEELEDTFKDYRVRQLQILRALRDSFPKHKAESDIAFSKIDEIDKKVMQVLIQLKAFTRDSLNEVEQAQLNVETVIQTLANGLKTLQIQQK
ncbi:MAG: hypothetical protein AABY26_02385 [Nanoarchaeota archaeon]